MEHGVSHIFHCLFDIWTAMCQVLLAPNSPLCHKIFVHRKRRRLHQKFGQKAFWQRQQMNVRGVRNRAPCLPGLLGPRLLVLHWNWRQGPGSETMERAFFLRKTRPEPRQKNVRWKTHSPMVTAKPGHSMQKLYCTWHHLSSCHICDDRSKYCKVCPLLELSGRRGIRDTADGPSHLEN